ncbi:hypothetical protein FE257_002416 [Aspergillus nanangensis]|uniref:Dipeptidyl peptidase 3 n=1 Tax=Aspergillus nanangensis TaxID=2582783 RepID=A0AAD4GP12_ASPNN|nr:hypothetical protein FE257_002416 [Aspergillus nanangensis]
MTQPQIYQLSVGSVFDGLTTHQKLYAHYMARAAWSGTRIILQQVSPEANGIFDFILALYQLCDGQWERLAIESGVEMDEVEKFLDYAAIFLSNVGNYFGSGDQKFLPGIPQESLEKLVSGSAGVTALLDKIKMLDKIKTPMFQELPNSLGPHGEFTQTTYYLGDDCLESAEHIAAISQLMEGVGILPENTRLRKRNSGYDIVQASVVTDASICEETAATSGKAIHLVRGDYQRELNQINGYLQQAMKFTANPVQKQMLEQIEESFQTGDLSTYKASQRTWVGDKAPPVETVIGFVEPYRDPLGVRGEFEGNVGIPDPDETRILNNLASRANEFVCRLPWVDADSGTKGPFEKELFEPPDFSSVHSLAYCSSIIFPGINLPNYNDIRQDTGYKNIIFSNRMVAESSRARGIHMVDESERPTFKKHRFHSYYIWVVLHEILGHGTGRFLTESTPGNFNFDPETPPINPLSGKPIKTWYRPGQTWTGVFEDLSTTVDECRAELVGAYLIDEPEILKLFGYTEEGDIKWEDLVYNMYLQLGVDGLRGLENYNPTTQKWGQAHSRAHYAMLRHLLRDSNGLYSIICDPIEMKLAVKVDRSRVIQDGKPSLGRMLLQLHIYRCTADKTSCRQLYEDLSYVDSDALKWREIVISKKDPPLAFCHANTYVDQGDVKLKEYEPTARGIIQSWAERHV